MAKPSLSHDDVQRLLSDPSGEARAKTAAKIAQDFGSGLLSTSERKLAEDIVRIMVKDAEVRVREALAHNLKQNSALPRDVAVTLAKDVDSVALPVIQFATVLTDADLIEIVRSQPANRQVAVARRGQVSEAVSDALVETGKEDVVAALVANDEAKIGESTLHKVVDRFGGKESIQGAMVGRTHIPVTIAERLVTMVSENLREQLVRKHELPTGLATDLVLQSRERATIRLSTESSQDEVEQLVRQLKANGRLTPSIVLRAVCMGDLSFFETALGELAGIPVVNARNLIHDGGPLGLKAIYDRAKLPAAYYTAARAAVDVARETDYDGGENDRERYSRRMIERILTQYGDLGVDFASDDLEYLLNKMGQLPSSLGR